jgi:hypothetical protein
MAAGPWSGLSDRSQRGTYQARWFEGTLGQRAAWLFLGISVVEAL